MERQFRGPRHSLVHEGVSRARRVVSSNEAEDLCQDLPELAAWSLGLPLCVPRRRYARLESADQVRGHMRLWCDEDLGVGMKFTTEHGSECLRAERGDHARTSTGFERRSRGHTGLSVPLLAALPMLLCASLPGLAADGAHMEPLPEGHECKAAYEMVKSSAKYSKTRLGRLRELLNCLKWRCPAEKIRIAQAKDAIEQVEKVREFIGTDIGLGFAGVMYTGETPVTEAYVDGIGVVRAREFLDDEVRVMAVASRLAWTWKKKRVGVGPLAVFNLGSQGGSFSNPVTSLGAGFLLAVRGPDDTGHGLGIGMAYAIDGNLRALRDDFVPGQSAPRGGDGEWLQPEYVRKSRRSLLLLVSYHF